MVSEQFAVHTTVSHIDVVGVVVVVVVVVFVVVFVVVCLSCFVVFVVVYHPIAVIVVCLSIYCCCHYQLCFSCRMNDKSAVRTRSRAASAQSLETQYRIILALTCIFIVSSWDCFYTILSL